MWKLRDRETVPTCGLGGGESPYELPMHNDQRRSSICGAPILSPSDRATTALINPLFKIHQFPQTDHQQEKRVAKGQKERLIECKARSEDC